MAIKRNVCVTTLAVTATAAALQANAQQTQSQEESVKPLGDWNYEEIYQSGGIKADNLLDAEVFGEDEDEIGSVENVLVTQDNKIAAIIAQVGGFWDIGDTHVLVPWEEAEEYISQQDLSRTQQVEDDVEAGTGVWKLTDLLDDYATVGDGIGYGYIDNILFSREGDVQAVIVETGADFGAGTYAYPFYGYGYGYGWNPGQTAYYTQYNEDEVGDMESFDFDQYEGLLDD